MNALSQLLPNKTLACRNAGLLICVLFLTQAMVAQNCADTTACNFNPDYVPSEYTLITEVIAENIGQLVDAAGNTTDLTGYRTTRIYFQTENPNDFVSSVSGTSEAPTYVTTTSDFYHSALGSATANSINGFLFGGFPDLEYDSWVTIGIEGVPNALAGEADVSTVQSNENPWVANFEPAPGAAGSNIQIDDNVGGAWYVLYGDANGIQACHFHHL